MIDSKKISIIWLIMVMWASVIVLRVGYWQIIKAEELGVQAESQRLRIEDDLSNRGNIYSSDGQILAGNVKKYTLIGNPQKWVSDRSVEEKISEIVQSSSSSKLAFEVLSKKKGFYVPIAKSLTQEQKNLIDSLSINGVFFEETTSRIYPEGSSSAHVVGFVANDRNGKKTGYFGLEGYYNMLLEGISGSGLVEKNANNNKLLISGSYSVLSQKGKGVATSIDRTVQSIAFNHLEKSLDKYKAKSGSVVILESSTGKVVSMVSIPSYDPNNQLQTDYSVLKNPIITDSYEPGSTFKVLVLAKAINEDLLDDKSECNICSGPFSVSGYTIGSWDNKYYPKSNMWEIIKNSDNVGMVYIAKLMGKESLLEALRDYGFGTKTRIDLQEEDTPIFRNNSEWQEIDWLTTSFGQGIAVTRLQLVSAINSLATYGLYIPPTVVSAVKEDEIIKEMPQPSTKRVVSAKAAAKTIEIMENAVNTGQVKWYKPNGFRVAGKTGTAQIPIKGSYSNDRVIASFVGFAPLPNPKFTMLVTLTDPTTSQWGSTTAAPLWFDIAKDLFNYYQITPN